MPFAINPSDGVRTYFEEWAGSGPPVLVYAGFTDPLEWSQASVLLRALREEYRLVFADHRGHGRSDKPQETKAYSLDLRTADAVAVLDALGIERVHFIGFSWGARLGFAIGERAPERLLSLVLCGNQPYEWDLDGPMARAVTDAVDASKEAGMGGFLASWESSLDDRFPEPTRTWMLRNDAAAIRAAFRSITAEGPISRDLTKWRVPCLIFAGAADEMHDRAALAAAEIPGATFLSLAGHTHLSAAEEAQELLPHVLDLFRGAAGQA
jgi:pimeloyl-ACP methyl ester carboxylesterase